MSRVCIKLFNGSESASDPFNSQYNKISLIDNYHIFVKKQNVIFACGPNTERRLEFEKRIQLNENKKPLMFIIIYSKY